MKGNDPQRWNKLLAVLDDKLQLNLLEHLHRVAAYHFEEDILYLEAASTEEEEYLKKDSVLQQLQLHAADALNVERIKIRPHSA